MGLRVATHHATFHADDVLAWAMLSLFLDPAATLTRTRDPEILADSDIVFDVGGVFDEPTCRFDHHQQSYGGDLSSAGMVLHWLEERGTIDSGLAADLRGSIVDYVDEVDTGRRQPERGVPCFAGLVDAHTKGCESLAEFDEAFHRAADMARGILRGLVREHEARKRNRQWISAAMDDAVARGSNLMLLSHWFDWKPPYYDLGGAEHPSEFVLQPDLSGLTWRIVAVPPERGSFDKKVPLPLPWAGLVDDGLAEVTGIAGARFCHKNRFIAVFDTREGALSALMSAGLVSGSLSSP